ncbi:MAG: SBBP repeat-containing protein [Candidatus Kapaibacterium sp.]
MKKLLLLSVLICFTSLLTHAQVVPRWVTASGSTGDDSGQSIALDSTGNSYVVGTFTNDISLGGTTLKSNGNSDIFVAKYSSDGSVLWAKNFGGTAEDIGYSIACEPGGTLVITGSFMTNAIFGKDTVKSAGGTDVFLCKLSSAGSVQWVQRFGSTTDDAGRGITVDDKGNYYVAGAFTDKITFPGTKAGTITSAGATDIFLAKYSTTGEALWAKRCGGTSYDEARALCFDKNGFIDMAGFFWGTATFPGGTATDLTSAGNYDCFVSQYSLDGVPQWARKAGGSSDDEPNAITVDDTGTIFVTGFYTGTATFSTDYSLKLGGMFLAKYTIDGFSEGAVRVGNTEADMGRGVTLDKSGNVYVIGNFYDKTDFGLSNIPDLISAGKSDVIIACYNYSGALQWARRAGGALNDNGNGIIADARGDLYVTGGFRDACSFPGGTIKDIGSVGGLDVFVGRYNFPTYTITGYITLNDIPLQGVLVSDGLRSATTGSNGVYVIENVPNGTYSVTPTKTGYSFLPPKATVIVKDITPNSVDFKAQIVLIAPELISPADKATNVSTSVTFSWAPAVSATHYRLQVSSSSIFSTLLVDDSTITTTSKAVSTLANSTEYYWRVATSDGTHWSDWSASRRLTTEAEIPGKVTLSSPSNEAVNVPVSTNLIWKTVQGAELYHLQLSTTSDFSTIDRQDSLLLVVLKTVSNLDISTKYYWRLRAKIGGLWGQWSDTWNFTTSNTVGVETPNSTDATSWSISPNPCTNGSLTIHGTASGLLARVSLETILGVRVLDQQIEGIVSQVIDISSLPAGVYRCTLTSGTGMWSQNVVVTR